MHTGERARSQRLVGAGFSSEETISEGGPMQARYLKSVLAGAATAACLLVLSPQAGAAPVTYTYDTTCINNCSNIGLADGAPVSGSIIFDDTNFAPAATITAADIISFDFTAGTFSVTNTTAIGGVNFDGLLAGDGQTFDQYVFVAANTFFPTTGQLFDLEEFAGGVTDNGFFAVNSYCTAPDCTNWTLNSFALLATDPLVRQTVTPPPPTHVPEPGTLALFGFGLAALGFARRRKTA
jgi:PEP-CTERM motif